jgi:Fe-S-cluster containining protein
MICEVTIRAMGDEAGRMMRALADLSQFHDETDEQVRLLARRHAGRLKCARGCSSCCIDGLSVFEVEAERIRRDAAAAALAVSPPRAPGACALLSDDGACRAYAARPYVCRTQGLPLRWMGTNEAGELVEMRDICPLNADGPPIVELREEECWTLGPAEERLRSLQRDFAGGGLRRVALRELF